jgi:hypothetical protein
MAVAHDAYTASHVSGSVSQSEASFSWTHTPSGTPRGVLVYAFTGVGANTSSTNHVTAVTYGGVSMVAVTAGSAADTVTEPMRTTAWFLGSGIPSGNQTVAVTRTNDSVSVWVVAITVTAGNDTTYAGVLLEQEDQALTEENINDGSPGTNSVRYVGIATGKSSASTALTTGANSTRLGNNDGVSRGAVVTRETTAGQGARPVGESATSDDVAAVYVAITEVSGGATRGLFRVPPLNGIGSGGSFYSDAL